MKINLPVTASFAAVFAAALSFAAPLTQTTAVHTQPDASSPAVSYLKAGSEPTAATDAVPTPAGWMAVTLAGPFTGWVQTKELMKQLDVKPGTPIRVSPEANGQVLTVAQSGDHTTITGIRGKWTQISLNKNLTGYIQVTNAGPAAPANASAAAGGQGAPVAASAPAAVADVSTMAAPPSNLPGQPAPQSTATDSANLPRQLTGKFVSTHSLLHPRRPYDWALDDNSGRRFAYLDISKLLLTEQPDKYIGHFVVVFGAAKPTPDGKDIVIQVDSLQLLMR